MTRRRGDAEEDAEKNTNRQKGRSRIPAFPGWRAEGAENAEERRPGFARMDKPEAYPTVAGRFPEWFTV